MTNLSAGDLLTVAAIAIAAASVTANLTMMWHFRQEARRSHEVDDAQLRQIAEHLGMRYDPVARVFYRAVPVPRNGSGPPSAPPLSLPDVQAKPYRRGQGKSEQGPDDC